MNELDIVLKRTLATVRTQLGADRSRWDKVAKRARITTRTIYNVMRPDYTPRMSTLSKLQKALEPARSRKK